MSKRRRSTRSPLSKVNAPAANADAPTSKELGVGLWSPLTMQMGPRLWQVGSHDEVSVQQLTAMRRTDGQARGLFRLLTMPMLAALENATFVPESGQTGGDEEANFAKQLLTTPSNAGGMVVPLRRVVQQMLMALFDGYAPFEFVYQVPKVGPLAGKVTIRKLAYRPAHTVRFMVDDNGEFGGLHQITNFGAEYINTQIPAGKSFYYAAQEEERPFYGRSYFESAYYHWDKKVKLYLIMHLAAQRSAVGTRIGKVPRSAANQELIDFQNSLRDLGFAQYLTIPNDFEVDIAREVSSFDFLSYISHHNSQMSKAVLATFFDESQGSGKGSPVVSFGSQPDTFFILMLQSIQAEIADIVNNQIIPRFIDWNIGSSKYPTFKWGPLTDAQKDAIASIFTAAMGSAPITSEFMMELEKKEASELGLEVDYEAVQKRLDAEKKAQEEATATGGVPNAGVPGKQPAPAGAPSPGDVPVPDGFQLSADGSDDDLLVLTRFVRTDRGTARYRKDVGQPIGKAEQEAQALEAKATKAAGATAGSVLHAPGGSGAKLIDHGDGTVTLQWPDGTSSPRQKFDVKDFVKLGWNPTAGTSPKPVTKTLGGGKPSTAPATNTKLGGGTI